MDAPLVYDYGAVNGYTPDGGIEIEQDAIMIEEIPPPFEGEEDPMVNGPPFVLSYIIFLSLIFNLSVNGVPKPYSQVTEEDHDLMTPDEYTAYFEILQARS